MVISTALLPEVLVIKYHTQPEYVQGDSQLNVTNSGLLPEDLPGHLLNKLLKFCLLFLSVTTGFIKQESSRYNWLMYS